MPSSGTRQDAIRAPQQNRSQQRVEEILKAAKLLILKHGCAGLKMSDIASTAGVSIGSIYQYFPNKHAIVAGLAQHYAEVFHEQVEQALAEPAADLDGLGVTMTGLLHSYYQMHRDDPVVRDIWMGSATDKTLQDIDANATNRNLELVHERSKHLFDSADYDTIKRAHAVAVTFAMSAVNAAVDQAPREGQLMMELAAQMLVAGWESVARPLVKD